MSLDRRDPVDGLRLAWCGRSSTGQVRSNNEDALWAAPLGTPEAASRPPEGRSEISFPGLLLAVADGMGGALAGEVASAMAVQTLGDEMARRSRWVDPERMAPHAFGLLLTAAVEAANVTIRGEGESNPQWRGMGTTLTVVWVRGVAMEIAQIGDSRAYRFRKGHLEQLTKDQSLVGKLIEDNIISEKEAEGMAGRNIILQALGTDEVLDVVHQTQILEPDDTLLLCTDGLSGVVNNAELEGQLQLGGDLCTICDRLVDLANQRGGPDNITVVAARAQRAS